ncbi:HK97-gp10 family putative phage morphogenesis protein [Paracoccus seriniphilus]|uniref:Phage protein, HK97 gp10 family n=1 Tax=Paracoccus seriniphilus TaxID=184748 RepID=A0A239Q2J4_9RHOB|nr:HK97-gp10 family putative phage morphogenesis protein [Paracoccus seriniphilus]WCR13222.1 HK97 gp10 family phage protein [Paracoccus seriniphilus]SNT76715.1 phage protein, HK97 gp10 family [Paracoccus seriniphilus]
MSVTIDVEGFAELEKALDNLSKSAGKAVLRRALKKAAQPTADLARSMAPVKTGKLAKSVIVGTRLDGRQARIHRRMFRDDKAAVEMFVGPSYLRGDGGRHGHLVEFGTSKMAARPFMRPAWDQDKNAMLERLSDELWAELEKSIRRAEKRAAKLAAKG